MIGAECLLKTLVENGIETCFMNPGTSEMQFVSALDRVDGMRSVLCLFEGVCSGAADGYARMMRRPAATLLHLGPGMGNGLANFHNARKARSPIVNIVGQHTSQHRRYESPLAADIEAFARPVSGYVKTLLSAKNMAAEAVAAIAAAHGPPGQVATLIVPADFSWSEAGSNQPAILKIVHRQFRAQAVDEAAELLKSPARTGLLLGGGTLLAPALEATGKLAAATGVRVFADRFAARMECGGGKFAPKRIAYFPEDAEPMLAGLEHLILVEATPPVSFFHYPGRRSEIAPENCRLHVLASIEEDGPGALEALVDVCGAGNAQYRRPRTSNHALPTSGALTLEAIGMTLGALMPDGAILSDEMVSSGYAVMSNVATSVAYDFLPVTGGSIGQGLPVAVGAAMACPGRKVIALEADGSAMYTFQSLWTMAREQLNVVTIIFANRHYRILDVEIRRTGAQSIGPRANAMMDLTRPGIDWVGLSESMGVPATRATTVVEFVTQFRAALAHDGPSLIEAFIP